MTFSGKKVGFARDRVPGEKKIFTIEADPQTLERFEKFMAYVQWCASVGHSTHVAFSIDGDGADRFRVVEDLPKIDEGNIVSKYSGEFEWIR